jgi:hypothetical protein
VELRDQLYGCDSKRCSGSSSQIMAWSQSETCFRSKSNVEIVAELFETKTLLRVTIMRNYYCLPALSAFELAIQSHPESGWIAYPYYCFSPKEPRG